MDAKKYLIIAALACWPFLTSGTFENTAIVVPGDTDCSESLDLSDAIRTIVWLFVPGQDRDYLCDSIAELANDRADTLYQVWDEREALRFEVEELREYRDAIECALEVDPLFGDLFEAIVGIPCP